MPSALRCWNKLCFISLSLQLDSQLSEDELGKLSNKVTEGHAPKNGNYKLAMISRDESSLFYQVVNMFSSAGTV